jgi:hypothetical protein
MHPRDHGSLTISQLPLKKKATEFVGGDFPSSGCHAQDGNSRVPWVCPTGAATPNPGFTAASNVDTVAAARVNGALLVWVEPVAGSGSTPCALLPTLASTPQPLTQAPTPDPPATAATNTVVGFSAAKGKGFMDFGIRKCSETGRCAYVIKTKHSWLDGPAGLQLTTTQQFGLDIAVGFVVNDVNPRVVRGFAGAEDPLKK